MITLGRAVTHRSHSNFDFEIKCRVRRSVLIAHDIWGQRTPFKMAGRVGKPKRADEEGSGALFARNLPQTRDRVSRLPVSGAHHHSMTYVAAPFETRSRSTNLITPWTKLRGTAKLCCLVPFSTFRGSRFAALNLPSPFRQLYIIDVSYVCFIASALNVKNDNLLKSVGKLHAYYGWPRVTNSKVSRLGKVASK